MLQRVDFDCGPERGAVPTIFVEAPDDSDAEHDDLSASPDSISDWTAVDVIVVVQGENDA